MTRLAEGEEILHHLLADLLIKGLIVVAAVVVLVLGVVLIWKKVGR
ncbi:hypothetical protein [Amycolatopsis jiangsuensis]|uniref:Succinate dehydrogenase hydrophobic anchor subunit n=1 Tax=Amycolatopsis jiangsuensis TaxID=1181879 RepID=A0A840ISS0_9PSEU|nr:hypothetical protein [Amycolatopsis jiangsuensis]MBB4684252.1 succinate dehydrogenase hydrophobic anchor subunit [Amycolatopsis jiangsuensis]